MSDRVGIILAGGKATRLYPVTRVVCKQLLPVYDKPMVYYPLSTLMLAGIREILVVATPHDLPAFRELLGNGDRWGIKLDYAVQNLPNGIAEALVIGAKFIDNRNCALILGDNVFFGNGMTEHLRRAEKASSGATIFCYRVADPGRYGVLTTDGENRPYSIVEKPAKPESDWAVTGLYLYDRNACQMATSLAPSPRGELEITDINNGYLEKGELWVEYFGRGITWFDAGTHDALLQASQFIQSLQSRSGEQVACLEEIAYRMGFIDDSALRSLVESSENASRQAYLLSVLGEK